MVDIKNKPIEYLRLYLVLIKNSKTKNKALINSIERLIQKHNAEKQND